MSESTTTLSLKEKGEKILETIEDIRLKRLQQQKDLSVLKRYGELMLQGIDPKDVKHYGYDPTKDMRIHANRFKRKSLPDVLNFVILNNGTRVDIDPILVPYY